VVRRLWWAIVIVTAVELAFLVGTLVLAPSWTWLPLEIFSVSAWPLGIGLLGVLAVGSFTGRRPESGRPKADEPVRDQPQSPGQADGVEIVAARQAARLLAEAARRPQGQAAMRRTGRLVRAVRAAARPPEAEGGGEPPRSSRPGG
jgi:hypothetical protein